MPRVHKPEFSRDYLEREYSQLNKSPYQIAEEYSKVIGRYVSHHKVRSDLKYYGVRLRGRSESQKNAFDTGRNVSPTKGKKLDESVKERIGKSLSERYKGMSDEYKQQKSEIGKRVYESLTDEQKDSLKKTGFSALHHAAKNGSKFERFLLSELPRFGYSVEAQKNNLTANEDLKVDLFIRDLNVCIEVDGPSHYLNLYNDDAKFAKVLRVDNEKNGLLLQGGYYVIRYRYEGKISKSRMIFAAQQIHDVLEKIKNNQINSNERLIYLEENKNEEGN